ncbi:MAG: hypothetical protein J6A17_02235 [Bacilli bacterium]|nr:hypothetical protein [Bacilli bacterium]MBO5414426.1 hypothetical protein [Bacilli bacterium]
MRINKKLINVFLISCITFSNIMHFPINVKAATNVEGKINANDVRLRSKPTTAKENGVSNIVLELDENAIVTVLNTDEKIEGSGCSQKWYKVKYQEHEGYICSKYINLNGYDQYERPWTSPKKAIVGGAKFIAKSYIAKGQFTSYLKKFNVNPNSYYDMYNHQYMANLAAPSSEAKTSWNTYTKNNLSTLPLEFSIPVFTDMAEVYNRPNGNLIEVEKQYDITDQEFENYLNSQGFPESYKPALRSLHTKHPNWKFNAMNSGSFTTAVMAEKNVSSIQGDSAYYEVVNGNFIQTEKNWYLANDATVAYYLDPRNFLTEKYILQFESLENSSNYTEAVVQSTLSNTFMDGISLIDNQTYASIFVEAANTANVSAVYLASLAIQESGRNGGSNTSGAQFEYEGTTYSGLYNFFNIGASSSASNPSKAGLVYASGGACTICSTTSAPAPATTDLSSYISNAGYNISENYVSGFTIGQSINELKTKLENGAISISTSEVVSTGAVISYEGKEYTMVVYGDLNGDGKINSADLLKMRKHLLGTETLTGAYYKASNLVNKTEINSADLLKLRQHLLGNSNIEQ